MEPTYSDVVRGWEMLCDEGYDMWLAMIRGETRVGSQGMMWSRCVIDGRIERSW